MKFIYSLLILAITPLVAFASESGSSGAHMLWRVIDFIIFAGLIVYFLKKPVVNYFKNRKKQIIQEIENAKKAQEEAQNALNQAQSLLSKLTSEVENIINTNKQMGEKEKEEYAKLTKELEEIFRKRLEQEKTMILNKAYKEFIEKVISKAITKAKQQFLSLSDKELRTINKRYFDYFGVDYDK